MGESFYELVHISAERFKAGDPSHYIEEDDALYWVEGTNKLQTLEDVIDAVDVKNAKVLHTLIQLRFTFMHDSATEFDVSNIGFSDTLEGADRQGEILKETIRLLDIDDKKLKFYSPRRNVANWFALIRYDTYVSFEGEHDIECGYIGALVLPEPTARMGSETGKISVIIETK